ncbi:hypothetical protein FOZ63_025667 [Perkinsus olseni]|nr:hypothetical protein FOZ63_025667 [Perkinsus olseni]KAF4737190.1 hypothetical protein FOZ62_028471 [Perkinsus olseni]
MEGTEDWSSLKIAVKKVKPQTWPYGPVHRHIITQSIACPKRGERGAFGATFDDESHNMPGYIHSCRGHFVDSDELYVFKFGPPEKAKSDPLLDLDNRTFSHIVERFDEFFGYLGLGAESTKSWDFRIDVSKLGVVHGVMKDFCPLVREAVRKHSRTFADLCDQTFTTCKEAISIAKNEGWECFPRGNTTYVLHPGSEESDIDAVIAYLC